MSRTGPAGRRRTLRIAAISTFFALVLLALVSIALVQFPTTNRNPPHVDAVVVLGALDQNNMAVASRLLRNGTSHTLVLSVADGEWGSLCRDFPDGITVICFRPDPSTTRGEAESIERLATEYGWRSLAVVTWTTHIARSRILVSRCYEGDLYLVDYADDMTFGDKLYEQLYQTASFVKAMVEPDC